MGVEEGGPKSEEEARAAAKFVNREPDPDPNEALFQIQEAKRAAEEAQSLRAEINELKDKEYLVIDDPAVFKALRQDYEGWVLGDSGVKLVGATGRPGAWMGSSARSIFFNDLSGELRVYNVASMDRTGIEPPR